MILNRLSKNMNDQNWGAATVEMVVVVISIVIGLGFSNWNEERLEGLDGEEYIERIAEELEQDIRFFGGIIRGHERDIENAQFLLDTIENEALVREDPTRFITSLARSGSSFVVNISNNTIEEIKFSGKLEWIEDGELRNEIVEYYDFIEITQTFSHLRLSAEVEYQKRYAGLLTLEQTQRQRDPSYSEVDALLVYERFLEKQDLIDWIPVIINTKQGTLNFSRRSQQNAEELLAKIRGEEIPEEEEQEQQRQRPAN